MAKKNNKHRKNETTKMKHESTKDEKTGDKKYGVFHRPASHDEYRQEKACDIVGLKQGNRVFI